MCALNNDQIGFILRDIKSRGVEMENLQANLLDHICCIMERELEPGEDFESFYRKTIPKFFKKELREIEEETIFLLTFKHYYTMKKVMITTGIISVVFFIAGSFFKIMRWPGASALLFMAIIITSFVLLPLFFILKTKEANSSRDKIILGIGTALGIMISLSTLFKVMHWPYANGIWLTSLGFLFFIFIPIYFFSGMRNPEAKINTITTSMLLVIAGGLQFTLTNLGPNLMNAFGLPDHLVRAMNENIEKSNIAMYESAAKDTAVRNKIAKVKQLSGNMSMYISQLKKYLLVTLDPDLSNIPEKEISFNQINYKENWDVPTKILIGDDPVHLRQGANSAAELKAKINEYRAGLLELLDDDAKREVSNYIGLNTDEMVGSKEGWESTYFYHNPLVTVIAELNLMQNEVGYAELVALTKLVKSK